MGGVIATLMDMGWRPDGPTRWTDPAGSCWDIDPTTPGVRHQLQDVLAEFIEADLWKKASLHYCGKGL